MDLAARLFKEYRAYVEEQDSHEASIAMKNLAHQVVLAKDDNVLACPDKSVLARFYLSLAHLGEAAEGTEVGNAALEEAWRQTQLALKASDNSTPSGDPTPTATMDPSIIRGVVFHNAQGRLRDLTAADKYGAHKLFPSEFAYSVTLLKASYRRADVKYPGL